MRSSEPAHLHRNTNSAKPAVTTASNPKKRQARASVRVAHNRFGAGAQDADAASGSRIHADLSLFQATIVVDFDEYTGRMQAPNSPASGPNLAGNTCVPPPGILREAGLPGAVSA